MGLSFLSTTLKPTRNLGEEGGVKHRRGYAHEVYTNEKEIQGRDLM